MRKLFLMFYEPPMTNNTLMIRRLANLGVLQPVAVVPIAVVVVAVSCARLWFGGWPSWCVAVCCGVTQSAAACCLLQWVAAYCVRALMIRRLANLSVLQRVAVFCKCVAACCSVLQCFASVWQCVAAYFTCGNHSTVGQVGMLQRVAVCGMV